jgi:rhodanese-related sulfurtransferase
MKTIDLQTLQTALRSNDPPILLEALPAKYFGEGHLPGAKHFPHDQVRALAPTLLPHKEQSLVVYCASDTCRNSHVAAQELMRLGYVDVRVYTGGKKDWESSGKALEKTEAR